MLANDNVSLAFFPGEVHCLLGDNGAGKSTLMNILSGMYQPDSGVVYVKGIRVSIDSPRRALELGIGTVYQHPTLIPVFTVLENLMLGEGRGLRLHESETITKLLDYAKKLGVTIDPHALAGRLALGQQQQIEIIKALWSGSSVLILDEPTSMLTPQGIEELEKVLLQLKAQDLAIIFITHKLHEALDIGDRITVLRRGRVVGAIGPERVRECARETLQSEIVEAMFGDEAEYIGAVAEIRTEVTGRRTRRRLPDAAVLELSGVTVPGGRGEVGITDVSLTVRAGEILGVAGVDGNGQRELAEAVAGQRAVSRGEISLEGTPITRLSVSERQKLGLRYVTDDRTGEGIVSRFSVGLNLVLKRIGEQPFWRRGRICQSEICAAAENLVECYDIRTPDVETPCGTLSGGNIQKVLLARELSFQPRIVVYNKPTYGLDVKTTATVRDRIRQMAEEEGVAALLISTDLEEILDLSDRIAVMYAGSVSGVVENEPGIEKEVGRLMVGGGDR
ncbi:MAG: ABC transporter ATP-binding protein [Thermoleophilia bacterium]